MITYQVDQCANFREFVETCKQQGLVDVWRFPPRLKDEKDPSVLANVLPSGRTLLTTDRQIHTDNLAHIPERHSGILIVAKTSAAGTITKRDVMRILSDFKSRFVEWHTLSLRDFIVEITESSVEVRRVVRGALQRLAFIGFDQPDWQAKLSAVLKADAGGQINSDSS